MTEFDDTNLTKDFSDQPITSLTDLASRMRGPQYRSALASQDRRPLAGAQPGSEALESAAWRPQTGQPQATQPETQASETQVQAASDAAGEPAWRDPFAEAAQAWDGHSAWSETPQAVGQETYDDANAWGDDANAWGDTGSGEARPMPDATYPHAHHTIGTYPIEPQEPVDQSNPHFDAQAIDEALSDLSPESNEWQRVAWHQEGPVSGHMINGNLRSTRRADLKAALSFDYAADDQDEAPYVPAYRPEARVPGFAQTREASVGRRDERAETVGHDMRAAGEAMAAERHSIRQAEIGHRLRETGNSIWRMCRSASLPQMVLIAGGVASSLVMGVLIWSLVSEPALRDPIYLAARPGPEKEVPSDPGGMHIANLGMTVLSDGDEPAAVQIIEGNRSSVMELSLADSQPGSGNEDFESIDDLIIAQQARSGAGGNAVAPSTMDQLIAFASLDTDNAAAVVVPIAASLEGASQVNRSWPPLPRRKEAAHGENRVVRAIRDDQTVQITSQPAARQPLERAARPGAGLTTGDIGSDLGTVSAAAPLSKQDDLGALVDQVEADPIFQLLMNEGLQSKNSSAEVPPRDLGESAMPEGRSDKENPAALILRAHALDGLNEAKADIDGRAGAALPLAPFLEHDGGLHSQAGMLGDFANWIVPSAQAVSEQLAQLRADGQGGLVAAPEAPEPKPVANEAAEAVVVPDGPWSPPLLPAEAIEPFGLQLASYRSLATARRSWETFKAKHPSLLEDLVLRVQQVQISGRGTFYRLQVGPFPNAITAMDLCQQLRQRGHRSCILVKKRK